VVGGDGGVGGGYRWILDGEDGIYIIFHRSFIPLGILCF